MTDDERMAILDELIALGNIPTIAPDEWTLNDYAHRAGISRERARLQVNRLLEQKIVIRRLVVAEGRRVWAYRRA